MQLALRVSYAANIVALVILLTEFGLKFKLVRFRCPHLYGHLRWSGRLFSTQIKQPASPVPAEHHSQPVAMRPSLRECSIVQQEACCHASG